MQNGTPGDVHPPQGSVQYANIETTEKVPIHKITVAHDQGWSRNLVSKAANGAPDLLVSNFSMAAHQHHPRHVHNNVGEVYYILDGRCRMEVGDQAEWIGPGTAVYVPRGTPHCVDTAEEGVSLLVIYPQGDLDKINKEFVEPDSPHRY